MIERRYVAINGQETLARDTYSMGIVNTNTHAMEASRRAHAEAMIRLAEQRRKDQELNNLRTEVENLKLLVNQLLEKK